MLDEQVALVAGGDTGVGRAAALMLAAHGVRVVVMGERERELGITVGEIVVGAGKARHVVGDVRSPNDVDRAIARAIDTFGRLDIVVARANADAVGASCAFRRALPRMSRSGHLVVVGAGAAVDALVSVMRDEGKERGIACNPVPHEGSDEEEEAFDGIAKAVAALVSGDPIDGKSCEKTASRTP